MGFIEKIAPLVQKYSKKYGISVCSPIIAQAILESSQGESELGKNAMNYFGMKYREGRVPCASGVYYKVGSEQNKDGSYVSSNMKWLKFNSLDSAIEGYFQFINVPTYANLKGITDPRTYLELIKKDGYATSLKYVDNLMAVIKKYDLTKYDNTTTVEKVEDRGYKLYTKLAHISNHGGFRQPSDIKYIVLHYTSNKTDLASSNAKYFQSANRKASAHYFVDKTSVYQSVEDNVIAWSVGGKKYTDCNKTGGGKYYNICTNANSISIELCSNNGVIAKETINNAIELIKILMIKYNVPQSNVIRHFDVNGKKCIGWEGWLPTTNESKWNEFKSRLLIKNGVDMNVTYENTTTDKKETIPQIETNLGFGIVTASSLNVRNKPSTLGSKVGLLMSGERVTIIGYSNGWYQIENGNWVSAKYIGTRKSRVTAYMLNIRNKCGLSGSIIDTFKNGEIVNILNSKNDENGNVWYLCQNGDRCGWCSSKYIV